MDYEKAYKELKASVHHLYESVNPEWKNIIESHIPELKEPDDERIRKAFVKHLTTFKEEFGRKLWYDGIEVDDALAWLEKQGNIDVRIHEAIKEQTGQRWKGEQCKTCGFRTLKPADKVEPKFKQGDWVVSPNSVYWHIDKIENGRYEVSSNTGACANWPLNTEIYHLFNIQDAEAGDVLAYRGGQWIFILKEKENNNSIIEYYALLSEDGLCVQDAATTLLVSAIVPATKEQRDQLYKAMHEAGYEWDENALELKKIEQKSINPTLKEKDEIDNGFTKLIMDNQKPTEWNISDFRTWQYIVSDILTKKDGIGQYLDSGECKKIAKYMQEEWSNRLSTEQKPTVLMQT